MTTIGLNEEQEADTCIACYEETKFRAKCCKAAICNDCYVEWLQTKRQCMHCKKDQCEFDVWTSEHRIDNNDVLLELLGDNEIFSLSDDSIVSLLERLGQEDLSATGNVIFELGVTLMPRNGSDEPGIMLSSTVDNADDITEVFGLIQELLDSYSNT